MGSKVFRCDVSVGGASGPLLGCIHGPEQGLMVGEVGGDGV